MRILNFGKVFVALGFLMQVIETPCTWPIGLEETMGVDD